MKGLSVVITTRPTGPYTGHDSLSEKLSALGCSSLSLGALSIERTSLSPSDIDTLQEILKTDGAWIAFLSPTAVRVFKAVCDQHGLMEHLARARFASQGRGTSIEIAHSFGREPLFESSRSTAECFAQEFAARLSIADAILVPQSTEGRDVLGESLLRKGFKVSRISTYQPKGNAIDPSVIAAVGACDPNTTAIIFMSPSAVAATECAFPAQASIKAFTALSIGPTTSKALRERGWKTVLEASEHSEEGILALVRGVRGK